MYFNKIKTSILLIAFIGSWTACEKGFEDLNQNPYNPTSTSMEALFNGIISSLPLTWDSQFYIDNEKLYDVTQLGALTAKSWSNTAIGIDAIWNNYYETLKNIRELELFFDQYEGDQEELNNVRAMLKIVLAYKTFNLTDLFGDIPFFNAGKGIQEGDFLRAEYDSQEAIYNFLLEELQWANEHIDTDELVLLPNGKPYYSFGAFDPLFNSNMLRWQKFANALRFRYALRIADKDRALADAIIKDIMDNNLPLVENNEDVLIRPIEMGFSKQSTHWSFREHKNLRMGSTIWDVMTDDTNPNGSGIIDPRAYIYFDTNNANEWAPYPNVIPTGDTPPVEGGIAYGSHRDDNFAIKGVDNFFSTFHYYLIRDEQQIPEILISAAEIHFHKAEAFRRGIGVVQDNFMAENEYTEGISSSINFWYTEAQNCSIWNDAPTISQTEIFQYIYSPDVFFSENDFDVRLIYTQEWLCYFRQPWEAFSLWRRTKMTPREGEDPQYYRLTYPADEYSFNFENVQQQISKMGSDENNVKVWWME